MAEPAEQLPVTPPVRRRSRRRWLIPVIVLAVVVGGGGGLWFATRSGGANYRTATAGPAQVTATLAATGTIEPVAQATAAFPVSGQVQTVAVHVGQQVTAGQQLAQLNTTGMAGQVSSAQSGVATAQAKLASDSASQTEITTSVTQPDPSTSTHTGSSGKSGSTSLDGVTKGLAAGQNSVKSSQQQVDADLTLVGAAVKQENATCPPVIQQLDNGATPTTTSGAPTTSTTPTGTTPGGSGSAGDCATLLQQVLADQQKAATAENDLAAAEGQLTTAVNQAVSAVQRAAGTSGSSTSDGRTTGSAYTGSGGSGSSGKSGSQPASAAQLAADQAAADAATAELAVAQQNEAAATLLSPIAGTVAEVDLQPGDTTAANSSTAHIVVLGPGATEVTTAVTDTQVGQVKPGQPVAVTPDGGGTGLTGTVTAIGQLATTTSGGAAGYPVTVTLGPTKAPLYAGSAATVAITLGSAHADVAVPTSAVHSIGGLSFLTVVKNGTATQQRVTLGVSGPALTQVTAGLTAGAQVVLANLDSPLPTSGSTTRGLTGRAGGGGFGGGGGGFGGGGARGGG